MAGPGVAVADEAAATEPSGVLPGVRPLAALLGVTLEVPPLLVGEEPLFVGVAGRAAPEILLDLVVPAAPLFDRVVPAVPLLDRKVLVLDRVVLLVTVLDTVDDAADRGVGDSRTEELVEGDPEFFFDTRGLAPTVFDLLGSAAVLLALWGVFHWVVDAALALSGLLPLTFALEVAPCAPEAVARLCGGVPLLLEEAPSMDVSVFLMLELLFTGDPALDRLAVIVDGLGIVSTYTT